MSYHEPKDATVFVNLDTPIPAFGDEIHVVAMRPLKAKDLRAIGNLSELTAGDMIKLISAVSNLPESAIDEATASDFTKLSEAVGSFFENGARRE